MNSLEFFDKFKNKNCDVLGFGLSNKPLVKLLLCAGAHVRVRDKNTKILDDPKVASEFEGAEFILGDSYLDGVCGDYVFRSPGIRHDLPEIKNAVSCGAMLTSEMEEFFLASPCKIFGITGSDGKTTTTTITHLLMDAMAKKAGRGSAYVGGNIGQPLLPLVSNMTEDDTAIVELSSFQLMTFKKCPERALITNVTPNHLNWHTDMDEYIEAKCNIFMRGGCRHLVLNADNEVTREIARNTDIDTVYFSSHKDEYKAIVHEHKWGSLAIYIRDGYILASRGDDEEKILDTKKILIPGRHNIENYMAAIGLTFGLVDNDVIENIATTFTGVRHRLELVRELDGVKYYNGSIDSSPTRTAAALSALNGDIVAICGGYDKNIPFDTLAVALANRARAVVLTGATMEKIYNEIEKCPIYSKEKLLVICEPDFDLAVKKAHEIAREGDSVILSPACASFDRFKNFEERGDRFCDLVRKL